MFFLPIFRGICNNNNNSVVIMILYILLVLRVLEIPWPNKVLSYAAAICSKKE